MVQFSTECKELYNSRIKLTKSKENFTFGTNTNTNYTNYEGSIMQPNLQNAKEFYNSRIKLTKFKENLGQIPILIIQIMKGL